MSDHARLRLLPTPRWEPPYDDEPGVDAVVPRPAAVDTATQGTLALTFLLRSGLPVVPAPRRLRLVDGSVLRCADDVDDAFGPQATSTAQLPDARGWAARLAQATVEVMTGTRPVAQLRRWTTEEVYVQVRQWARGGRVADPVRDARRPGRVVLRALRVCEPTDGVAEACAVVDDGTRCRAIALRLEGRDGRWRCTSLVSP